MRLRPLLAASLFAAGAALACDAPHPLLQNVDVARRAVADCGSPAIMARIDELDVVRSLSWHYDDFPGALSTALGLPPGARQFEI